MSEENKALARRYIEAVDANESPVARAFRTRMTGSSERGKT
jgi:hypothetical protein